MFGHRPDGKKIKGIGGFDRLGALLMGKTRVESTCYFNMDLATKHMDKYIATKREKGIEYTYRDIIIATLVRVFYLRPRLNRFIYAGTFYQRKHIDISMVVHKSLKSGELETTIKCRFTGKETLAEVKAAFDNEIKIAREASTANNTDAFAKSLDNAPTWFLRMIAGLFGWFDRRGLLSDKFLFSTSPFHCSVFFADMKSVHLDAVLHHLYNFGNCGFFCTMGKEKMKTSFDEKTGQAKSERIVELGISEDERFIDGLTWSHVLKQIRRILENLECLETAPTEDEIRQIPLTPLQAKAKVKADKKAAKKQVKKDRKIAKKNKNKKASE